MIVLGAPPSLSRSQSLLPGKLLPVNDVGEKHHRQVYAPVVIAPLRD